MGKRGMDKNLGTDDILRGWEEQTTSQVEEQQLDGQLED